MHKWNSLSKLTIVLGLAAITGPVAAEHVQLVKDGRAVSLAAQGGAWRQTDGGIEAAGNGVMVWSRRSLGPHDVTVRARLRVTDLAGSAALCCKRDRPAVLHELYMLGRDGAGYRAQ